MDWLFFDSTGFVFKVLNAHWLVLGFLWGVFKIYAKRSKNTIDDDFIAIVNDLKKKRQSETE